MVLTPGGALAIPYSSIKVLCYEGLSNLFLAPFLPYRFYACLLPVSLSRERDSLCPFSQQRPMRTNLACCLGLIDDSQHGTTPGTTPPAVVTADHLQLVH